MCRPSGGNWPRPTRSSKATRARSRLAIMFISKTRCSSVRSAPASACRHSGTCVPATGCMREFQFKSLDWDIKLLHNGADFYDLFGPVQRSRRGQAAIAAYSKTLIYDVPRQLDVFGSAAFYTGLERLPSAQNVPSPGPIGSLEAGSSSTIPVRRWAASIMKRALPGAALASMDVARAAHFPSFTAASIMACRCRSRTLGLGLCPCRKRLGQGVASAQRLLLRLVRQQLRR